MGLTQQGYAPRLRRYSEQERALAIMRPGLYVPRGIGDAGGGRIGRHGPTALAAAGTTIITCPANRVMVIKSIEVANVLGNVGRLRLDIQSAGSKLLEFHAIPSYATVTIPLGYPLLAGEILRGYNPDDAQTALHATVYAISLDRAYFDSIGGTRGFVQMTDGGVDGNEVKTVLTAGARDVLVTSLYTGTIEAGNGIRRPYFGPGPHKYHALPQGEWVTHDDPYHLPANSSLTWANPGAGWCAAAVAGLSGVDF